MKTLWQKIYSRLGFWSYKYHINKKAYRIWYWVGNIFGKQVKFDVFKYRI